MMPATMCVRVNSETIYINGPKYVPRVGEQVTDRNRKFTVAEVVYDFTDNIITVIAE